MRTNADITLYNRYNSSGIASYNRTVIHDVAWESRKASNVLASGGNIAADQANIYIPMQRGDSYQGPAAWRALTIKGGRWTLQPGDLIVRGIVTEELSGAYTPTTLRKEYDNVLEITSVDLLDNGSANLSHWKVGAK